MMKKTRSVALGALLLALPLAAAVLAWPAEPTEAEFLAQIPDEFVNLQVLPEDIGKRELVNQMRSMAIGLGVRCWFCHEGEGDDFSTFDFPKDVKPTKQAARLMLRMVKEINENHIANLDPELAMGQKVSCITCHQQQEHPPGS